MVIVNIETSGKHQKLIRGFTRFENEMKDLREPFKMIIKDFYAVEEVNFVSGGRPEKFAPIDKKYEAMKKRKYPGKTIMRLHDNLFNALTGRKPSDTSKAKSDIKIRKNSLYLGVISPYFLVQESRGRKAIQLTPEIKRRWAEIIHKWAYQKYKNEVIEE